MPTLVCQFTTNNYYYYFVRVLRSFTMLSCSNTRFLCHSSFFVLSVLVFKNNLTFVINKTKSSYWYEWKNKWNEYKSHILNNDENDGDVNDGTDIWWLDKTCVIMTLINLYVLIDCFNFPYHLILGLVKYSDLLKSHLMVLCNRCKYL